MHQGIEVRTTRGRREYETANQAKTVKDIPSLGAQADGELISEEADGSPLPLSQKLNRISCSKIDVGLDDTGFAVKTNQNTEVIHDQEDYLHRLGSR